LNFGPGHVWSEDLPPIDDNLARRHDLVLAFSENTLWSSAISTRDFREQSVDDDVVLSDKDGTSEDIMALRLRNMFVIRNPEPYYRVAYTFTDDDY
jgi:hypothetical protein